MLYEILQAQIRAARLVHNPETLRDPFRENFCKQSDKSKNFRGQIWLAFAREERTKYEEHVCTYGNLCCHLVATAELCTSGSNEEDELKFRANFISLRHQEEKFVRKKKTSLRGGNFLFHAIYEVQIRGPRCFHWMTKTRTGNPSPVLTQAIN